MIRITVELVPLGQEDLKQKIGMIEICNTANNRRAPMYGNYKALIKSDMGDTKVIIKDHFRASGWIALLYKVLKEWDSK